MSESLSSEMLDEIERRCAAATTGPWKSWWEGRDHDSGSSVITTGGEDIYLSGGTMADQDFIAHARQDVPALIREVRALRAATADTVKRDEIAEVGIDPNGSLYVRPKTQTFPFIYRAAMGVRWDADSGCLSFPKSTEWSYPRSFAQILAAAENEYRIRLVFSPATIWSVPEAIRSEIESQIQKGPV